MRPLLVLTVLLASVAASQAAQPEQAYLAARDHAIAALKTMKGDKQDAEERRLHASLEKQLKSFINPPRLEGFPSPAKMSPDSLSEGDVGYGGLDGLELLSKDDASSVLVTTEELLRAWLLAHKNFWNDRQNPPTDPEEAFRSEIFYTQGVSSDASVSLYGALPIRKPEGATIALAHLASQAQDIDVDPPDQIAVAVVKNRRVFIALVKATTKPAPIAACDAVWKEFKLKSDAMTKKYQESNLKDEKSFDESTRLEEQGAAAFHKCWSEKSSAASEFPALTKQAQAFVDLLASQ